MLNDTLIPWIITPSHMPTKETDGTTKMESLFQRAYGKTRHFMRKETKRPSEVSPPGPSVPCPPLRAGSTQGIQTETRGDVARLSVISAHPVASTRHGSVRKRYFPAWDRLLATKARAFFCLEYKWLLVKWLTRLDYKRIGLSEEDGKTQICWINRKQCDQ